VGSAIRSPWDHLRKTKRDEKVFAALKARFPDRYRQLMEQYMRSLKQTGNE
jgi:hypothetical protein